MRLGLTASFSEGAYKNLSSLVSVVGQINILASHGCFIYTIRPFGSSLHSLDKLPVIAMACSTVSHLSQS